MATSGSTAGAAPVRVPQVPWHPLTFSNRCLAPVLKCPWVSKSPFVIKNTKILSSNFTFKVKIGYILNEIEYSYTNIWIFSKRAPVLLKRWNRP